VLIDFARATDDVPCHARILVTRVGVVEMAAK